ncbi:MAG: ABC transporter permease [Verrucomicrobiales bacterium]|nr:ABC transporter permease [Verrucomicrobiales bacterium]
MVAILDRELRIRARQRRTFVHRFLIALATSGVTVLSLVLASLTTRVASVGQEVFGLLSWVLFGLCLLEGLRNAADSISEEKREGTLGLLFLTDLSAAGIILGKTSGQLLSSLYALMSAIPALSIPIMLGGVTGGEFWRAVLALFLTLLASLSLGILVSAWVRGVIEAWIGTALLLLAMLFVLPALMAWLSSATGASGASPFAMRLLRAEFYDPSPGLYWQSMGYYLLVIVTALGLACWVLPRRWQQTTVETKRMEKEPVTRMSETLHRLRDHRPMEWFAQHRDVGHPILLVISVILASALVLWALLSSPERIMADYFAIGASAFAYHLVLSTYQVLKATSLGSALRATGLLELIFITPLRPQETVLGLGRGLLRQGLKATGIFSVGEILCLAILIGRAAWFKELPLGPVIAVSVLASLIMWPPIQDLWAGTWLGLYQGLQQPKPTRAVMLCLGWVQGAQLICYYICLPLGPILSAIKSLVIFLWSRDRLLFELPRIVRADTLSIGKEGGKRSFKPLPSVIPPPLPPAKA